MSAAPAAVQTAGPPGMGRVPGGEFLMGSDDFYPEERPAHRVAVDGFWIDRCPVTVAEFAAFVAATGWVTVAERRPDPADYPGVDPALLVPGSLVFRRPPGPVPLDDPSRWWAYVPGASWRSPQGPGSGVGGRERHPVTHVAFEDAAAYAAWAGKELPTEAEWERAARGGLDGAAYTWGDEPAPEGQPLANVWQGDFPWRNFAAGGFGGTSPVGSFPPNGYGLHDMAGNLWEWTDDLFRPRHEDGAGSCCVPRNPRVRTADPGAFAGLPDAHVARRVVKGGSHLCAPGYCLRYRPAARQGEAEETSTGHIGFRCVVRDAAGAAEAR